MGPVLKGLIELQIVESKLRGMKTRLDRAKRAVVLQQKQLNNLEENLQSHKDAIKGAKKSIDEFELELGSREENVQKYKTALNEARNNKEYAAILTELNTNKADNTKIEAKIIEQMNYIEEQEQECQQLDIQIEDQKQLISDITDKAADKVAECEQAIEKTKAERDEVAQQIPKDALDLFDKLCDNYDGEAVAYIEQAGSRIKNYSCGGCFMSVTAETINQLMSKDDISQCKNCGRILVVREEKSE